ncbi:MAG: 50S ribosomal protein L13 [Dehalococcoidia bacterium]|nr:50S ribosomal protein L13 [Dehalococcoidia bacterium]
MTTKTFRLSAKRMDRAWHVVDAGGRPLGRVANEAARLLLGKHKPTYEPHLAMGDFVVVINAKDVAITGAKAGQKVYYRHSGYPGGLKERTFEQQMEKDPRRVIERAVKGMLPHNSRGRELFRHLKVYAGGEHPHEAQLNAGTGSRARKSAARAEREATTAATAPAPRASRPATGPQAAAEAAPEAAALGAAGADVAGGATAVGAQESELRLSGSLQRHTREELDSEAQRLGIEIDPEWNKGDVATAIEAHYEEHPVATGDEE